jgi:hypothetical protein
MMNMVLPNRQHKTGRQQKAWWIILQMLLTPFASLRPLVHCHNVFHWCCRFFDVILFFHFR